MQLYIFISILKKLLFQSLNYALFLRGKYNYFLLISINFRVIRKFLIISNFKIAEKLSRNISRETFYLAIPIASTSGCHRTDANAMPVQWYYSAGLSLLPCLWPNNNTAQSMSISVGITSKSVVLPIFDESLCRSTTPMPNAL